MATYGRCWATHQVFQVPGWNGESPCIADTVDLQLQPLYSYDKISQLEAALVLFCIRQNEGFNFGCSEVVSNLGSFWCTNWSVLGMVFHNFLASWDGQRIFHRDSWLRRYSFLAHFLGVSGEACRQTSAGQHQVLFYSWKHSRFHNVERFVWRPYLIHSDCKIHGFP